MGFFDELQVFSDRFIKANMALPESRSPWGGDRVIRPEGAVIHYTADEDVMRVLRWFMLEKHGAKASSHVVVFDRKWGSTDKWMADLPLVQALPVTVIQCRKPTERAYHATWCNNTFYGIENIGAGELRKDKDGGFVTWQPRDKSSPEWTMPWHVPYKTPVEMYGRWWSPFTKEQVAANVLILRHLHAEFPLQPATVVGHEQVQGVKTPEAPNHDKRDPGPAFPIHGVRSAVFARPSTSDGVLLETTSWFNRWASNPHFLEAERDGFVIEYAKRVSEVWAQPPASVVWKKWQSAMEALPAKGGVLPVEGKAAFLVLGYYMDGLLPGLTPAEVISVRMFQHMSGLTVDGDPGPKTRAMLVERLKDRGFWYGV